LALSTRNVSTTTNTALNTANFTATHTYTAGAGTELLAVAARWEGADSANIAISAVRWADSGGANAEALTEAVYVESTQTGEDVGVGWYYLANPTARSGQVEVDYTISGTDISSWSITALEVVGGEGLRPPIGAVNSNSGISANASLSITSTVEGSLILSSVAHYGGDTDPFTPAAGITSELADGDTGNSQISDHGYWVGQCLTTTVGSYDVGATGAANDDFAVAAFEVIPGLSGSLSATQAADTASSASTLGIAGSLSNTQGNSSLAAAATLSITGALSATQADSTLAAAGGEQNSGEASLTQAGDTASAVGALPITGALVGAQAGNTLSAIATLAITGSAAVPAAGDSLAATGTIEGESQPEPEQPQTSSGGSFRYFTPEPQRKRKEAPRQHKKEVERLVLAAMERDPALSRMDAEIMVLMDLRVLRETQIALEARRQEDEEEAIALLLLAA
jgi:hypothetical protein